MPFLIGYVLLEIPGTILVISWGLLASLTGLIQNAQQFYWIRSLLGAAEAGFFPGIIVYMTHWFRYEDRGKAVAMFMAATPVANIIGAPKDARWLPEDERDWLTRELEAEKQTKKAAKPLSVWQALRNRDGVLLMLVYFFIVTANYSFGLWLPKILKQLSGLSSFQVSPDRGHSVCGRLAGDAGGRLAPRPHRRTPLAHSAAHLFRGPGARCQSGSWRQRGVVHRVVLRGRRDTRLDAQ